MTAAATSPRHGRWGYRPALDGLRAISVLVIIAFHLPIPQLQGAFLGVNVFFVVSGYLITRLLLIEHDAWGRLDLLGFYARRVRRLLPALLVLVCILCLSFPALMGEKTAATFRGDALSSLFYVANWRMILTGQSYFEAFGAASPFRHLWTLGIEEQFYLLFPVLLIVAVRLFGHRVGAILLIGAVAIASAIEMALVVSPADVSRAYYGTDTRIQDLLVGAVLALVLQRYARPCSPRARVAVRASAAIGGAVCLVAFWVVRPDAAFFRGGFLAFDLSVAAVVLHIEWWPRSRMGAVLATPVLAWVGRMSYGLYLWHWPVIVVLAAKGASLPGPVVKNLAVALTFALAAASHYYIEDPVRRGALRRRLGARAPLVSVSAIALATALAVASTVGRTLAPDLVAGRAATTTAGQGSFRLLLVGDSVGFNLGYAFPASDYPQASIEGVINAGCGTAEQSLAFDGRPQPGADPDQCAHIFDDWRTAFQRNHPAAVVWSLGGWEVYDHYIDGRVLSVGSVEYRDYLLSRLDTGLEALSPGPSPVYITQVPCYRQASYVVGGVDLATDRNDPARGQAVNDILRAFASRHPERVRLLDTGSLVCPDGHYVNDVNGVQLRSDGVHYSPSGAKIFWARFLPGILAAG